ncbi:50S ribosomal protein L21 [Candidatus Gottesmanbacteria bacterium]|nr:50S ribosomal protein L21 [Candidatus Gottesmanbacteria bacterium]
MYAVIKTGGKQYKVFEGEILEIDKLQKNPGEQIEFGEVLLVVKNGEVKIGQPTVPGTKVTAKILEQIKGKKIRIARFKAKVRYRRVKGFRAFDLS